MRIRGVKLRHLRLVETLSNAQSLSQAAQRLHVSAAAVSKAAAELEEVFQGPVFERGRGWLRLTPLGETILASARAVNIELDNLSDAVDGLHGGYRGELVIGTKAVSLHPFLAATIAAFAQLHPLVRIRLVDGSAEHLQDQLKKGHIQLLFARLSTDIVQSGLRTAAVLSDEVVLVASQCHPLVGQRRINWRELVTQRWCLPAPGTLMRDHLEQILHARRLGLPREYVETSDMTMVGPLFTLGHYVTIVPRRVAGQYLMPPVGTILPMTLPPVHDAVGIIWNDILPLRPAARHFCRLALERAKAAQKG
ncbi:LysR substrate-binding domain-containing protein [Ottowia sp. VDI28]|uniref:LysR substrate-binding domain-containing protein n=1 Tax=Ottowia sp. VDI28 TaxID=3133968 RepID=UPI003C30738C